MKKIFFILITLFASCTTRYVVLVVDGNTSLANAKLKEKVIIHKSPICEGCTDLVWRGGLSPSPMQSACYPNPQFSPTPMQLPLKPFQSGAIGAILHKDSIEYVTKTDSLFFAPPKNGITQH